MCLTGPHPHELPSDTHLVNIVYGSLAGTAVNDAEEAGLKRESLRSLDRLLTFKT